MRVRFVYAAILLAFPWPPLNLLYWWPVIGTFALAAFGYCVPARFMSLMPWNRQAPLTWRLIRRTFFSAPVRGNIRQGLPATP